MPVESAAPERDIPGRTPYRFQGPSMEILFAVPFALLWGIPQEARHLVPVHYPGDVPPPLDHVPQDDIWAWDVAVFDRMLARPAAEHIIFSLR